MERESSAKILRAVYLLQRNRRRRSAYVSRMWRERPEVKALRDYICTYCGGSGKNGGKPCTMCNGTGEVPTR